MYAHTHTLTPSHTHSLTHKHLFRKRGKIHLKFRNTFPRIRPQGTQIIFFISLQKTTPRRRACCCCRRRRLCLFYFLRFFLLLVRFWCALLVSSIWCLGWLTGGGRLPFRAPPPPLLQEHSRMQRVAQAR